MHRPYWPYRLPALIYSTHRLDHCYHFHLCSLVGRYTVLEVWAVRRTVRVCCGSRWGRCVLFINILDSLTAPCLVYNTAMYTVYGRCICSYTGWCSRCVVYTDPMTICPGLRSIASSCSNSVLGNLFAQPLSMSSLVYLLVWSPPPHIPYISSPIIVFFSQHMPIPSQPVLL